MIILGSGKLFANDERNSFINNGAVAVEGAVIAAVGDSDKLRALYHDAEFIDVHGSIIMPGLINAHTHISRALARGAGIFGFDESYALSERVAQFESHLDLNACINSAYAMLTDSISRGVTSVLDMFTCCSDPRGILFVLAGITGELGIRAVLCFGTSSSSDFEAFKRMHEENLEFIDYYRRKPSDTARAVYGIGSLCSFDDNELSTIRSSIDPGIPLCISLSEGPDDSFYIRRKHGCSPSEWLKRFGLITSDTILAHCGCFTDEEAEIIAESGASVVHTPFSDIIRRDVKSDMIPLLKRGITVGTGTDGIVNDVLELPKAVLANGCAKAACISEDQAAVMLLKGNTVIASKLFGCEIGVLKPGSAADIAVFDYSPYTELNENNLIEHLLTGMSGAKCSLNMVNGRILMRDGKLLTCRDQYLHEKTAAAARLIWDRYKQE